MQPFEWWDYQGSDPWTLDIWPWVSSFLQSPGFGALAAVIAATIAFIGVRRQTRLNAWWQRAEWALELLTRDGVGDEEFEVALAALRVLQTSKLAKKEEQRFLREIVDASTLDPDGDGTATDDDDAPARTRKNAERPRRRCTLWGSIRGILVGKSKARQWKESK